MIRASALASAAVLCLAAAASAQETGDYVVQTRARGDLFRQPPKTRGGRLDFDRMTRLVRPKDPASKKTPAQTTLPVRFPFFGRIYEPGQTLSVSEDGWLAFGAAPGNPAENPTLPSDAIGPALMAPLWDDLQAGARAQVVAFLDGGDFVVAWLHMDTPSAATSDDISFEVVLHPTSGVVDFAYGPGAAAQWSGLSYTTGIQSDKSGGKRRVFPKPDAGEVLGNTGSGRPANDLRFQPMTVTIHGQFTRDRPSVSATSGLGSTTEPDLPVLNVVGADVEVLDTAGVVVARATTGNDGAFTATSIGYEGAFEVNLLASGVESRVKKNDGSTWRLAKVQELSGLKHAAAPAADPTNPPALEAPALHLGSAFDATDFRKALNVQQAARRGFDWAGRAIDASTLDQKAARKAFARLEILLDPGADRSGFVVANGAAPALATIAGSATNDDSYDDHVILREYGQHLLAAMETWPGNLASHLWDPADVTPPLPRQSEGAAFIDGFAHWFGTAVVATPWPSEPDAFPSKFIDTRPSSTAVVFDLNAPDAVGVDVAGAVAGALWDLVDPADVVAPVFDGVEGALPADGFKVFARLDQRTTTAGVLSLPASAATWTSQTFFAAWIVTAPQRSETAREFIRHKAVADDAFEPNDAADATPNFTSTFPIALKMTALVLTAGNEDRFKFTFDATKPQIALAWPESTRIELSILDVDGNVVAGPVVGVGPRPGTLVTAGSATIVLPPTTPPATYVARVVSLDGPSAHYSLAISAPVSLDPPVAERRLPDATVDESYSATIATTGGFTTDGTTIRVNYRFDDKATAEGFDASVPGLSLVSGQKSFSLTGKPTVGKDYKLRVLATDESGALDRDIGTLRLLVNAPPAIASVFAVAAGEQADFDVGTGGTGATWVVTSPATDSGFTMTGGPTLHVSGRSDAAASFVVRGYMTGEKFDANLGQPDAPVSARVVVAPFLADFDPKLRKPQRAFGFAFDAVAGSDFDLDVEFRGSGTPPRLLRVLDSKGARQGPDGLGSGRARPRVHVGGFKLKTTGTYFVLFEPSKDSDGNVKEFEGSMRVARPVARPPRRFAAVADIADDESEGTLTFSAVPGSRVTVTLRKGRAPTAALPGGIAIRRAMDDTQVFASTAGDGAVKTFADILLQRSAATPTPEQRPKRDEYVVTFTAAAGQAGPLVCEAVVSPPADDTLSTHFLR